MFCENGGLFCENGSLFFENGSMFFENGSLFCEKTSFFSKMGVCFSKMGVCFLENGRVFLMMKMIDRPNTTPIGQDRASQWRNVTFSILICLKLDLVVLRVFDDISV